MCIDVTGTVLAECNDECMVSRRSMSVSALETAQTAAGTDSGAAELKTDEEPVLVEQLAA